MWGSFLDPIPICCLKLRKFFLFFLFPEFRSNALHNVALEVIDMKLGPQTKHDESNMTLSKTPDSDAMINYDISFYFCFLPHLTLHEAGFWQNMITLTIFDIT